MLLLKKELRYFISVNYYTYFLSPFFIDTTLNASLEMFPLDIFVMNLHFDNALQVFHNHLNNTPHYLIKDLHTATSKGYSRSVVCGGSFSIVTLVSLASLIVAKST